MSDQPLPIRKQGRPRSEAAQKAILITTALMMQTTPIRKITIGGIAKAAGVGKPTIYRWWGSKCALVMDAYLASAAPHIPFPDLDDLTIALAKHVKDVVRFLGSDSGRIAAEMVGEGQSDPHILLEFRERFFSRLLDPPRAAIESAKKREQIDTALDTDMTLDLIYGPIYYRLLMGHGPLDQPFADALATRIPAILLPTT